MSCQVFSPPFFPPGRQSFFPFRRITLFYELRPAILTSFSCFISHFSIFSPPIRPLFFVTRERAGSCGAFGLVHFLLSPTQSQSGFLVGLPPSLEGSSKTLFPLCKAQFLFSCRTLPEHPFALLRFPPAFGREYRASNPRLRASLPML